MKKYIRRKTLLSRVSKSNFNIVEQKDWSLFGTAFLKLDLFG